MEYWQLPDLAEGDRIRAWVAAGRSVTFFFCRKGGDDRVTWTELLSLGSLISEVNEELAGACFPQWRGEFLPQKVVVTLPNFCIAAWTG